jgi:hypothetical protein
VDRARQAAAPPFVLLTHVDEGHRLAGGAHMLDVGDRELADAGLRVLDETEEARRVIH